MLCAARADVAGTNATNALAAQPCARVVFRAHSWRNDHIWVCYKNGRNLSCAPGYGSSALRNWPVTIAPAPDAKIQDRLKFGIVVRA
jgi:hypothetical protein